MKISISHRLFLAVLLTSLAVAATGLWMLRDSVQRGFSRYVTQIELGRLGLLADRLESDYRRDGHWPALADDQRRHWLQPAFERLRHEPFAEFSGMFPDSPGTARLREPPPFEGRRPQNPPPFDNKFLHAGGQPPGPGGNPMPGPPDRFSLHERVGLSDADGHYLAGMPASPDAPRRALHLNDQVIGYLTLVPSADPSDAISRAFLADQKRQFLLIGLVCVLLSALAAFLLATHFRRPIRQLVTATGELTRGRFDTRIDVERSDELGALGSAVNRLAAMLEQHEASRRQWVADTSHELRTPVAVLRAQIEALVDGVRQPGEAQFMAMQRQVTALGRLIDELHELARADVGQLQHRMRPIHPWEVVVAEAESFRDRFIAAGLHLRIEAPLLSPELPADEARLQQVMANLLENSLRYTDAGGEVVISSRLEKNRWLLQIDDTAPGVPEDALEHLGTRFYRVERSRNRAFGGSGLGLALCQRIAEAHGGHLQFTHSPLGGLRSTLALPLRAQKPSS